MVKISGKYMRSRFTALKLDELSSVDSPAQKGARAVIMKRDDSATIKGEKTMPKSIEQLEAELTKANADLAAATARAEKAEADVKKAKQDCDAAMEDAEEAKAALAKAGDTDLAAQVAKLTTERDNLKEQLAKATDEVVTVAGREFHKRDFDNVVQFEAMKASQEEAAIARFEKQAAEDFSHVPGTAAEKALLLKARDAMDDEAKAAFDKVLGAAEKMAKAGFESLGVDANSDTPTQKAAQADFETKVSDIAKRDSIKRSDAISKARREFPTEFKAAYPDQAAN